HGEVERNTLAPKLDDHLDQLVIGDAGELRPGERLAAWPLLRLGTHLAKSDLSRLSLTCQNKSCSNTRMAHKKQTNRSKKVLVAFTPHEHASLTEAAKAKFMAPATYIYYLVREQIALAAKAKPA